jgi:hypothetical protein
LRKRMSATWPWRSDSSSTARMVAAPSRRMSKARAGGLFARPCHVGRVTWLATRAKCLNS